MFMKFSATINQETRGHRIADLLRGIWRPNVFSWDRAVDERLVTALKAGGVFGVASRRLVGQDGPFAAELRITLPCQALVADVHAMQLADMLAPLRAAGIDPILLKGLAVARYYPVAGCRQLGDIDLLLPPAHLDRASAVVAELGYRHQTRTRAGSSFSVTTRGPEGAVDLRTHLWPLPDTDACAALRSDHRAAVNGVDVRVLPRDLEIRYLAVHAAKHGFARPIWLCDLAAAVEHGADLDWDRLAKGSRHIQSCILASLGLTSRLLGLELPPDVQHRSEPVAAWIESQVLARWGGRVPIDTTYLTISALKRRDLPVVLRSLVPAPVGSLEALTTLAWPLTPTLAGPAIAALVARRALLLSSRMVHEILPSRG